MSDSDCDHDMTNEQIDEFIRLSKPRPFHKITEFMLVELQLRTGRIERRMEELEKRLDEL